MLREGIRVMRDDANLFGEVEDAVFYAEPLSFRELPKP